MTTTRPLWVFGYGSLLWDPGFVPEEAEVATLAGYHRSFCMLSIHHRGTVADPGLVLALDARGGAQCVGLALRVADARADAVLAGLRDRELVSSAYLEREAEVTLQDGRRVTALVYVIDPDHPQYCRFDLDAQARIIARSTGGRGLNRDYLFNTAGHLARLGIADPDLDWLAVRVRSLMTLP